jgi:hypothetical protein
MAASTSLILIGLAVAVSSGLTVVMETGSGSGSVGVGVSEHAAGPSAESCVRYSDWTPTRMDPSCDPLVQETASTVVGTAPARNLMVNGESTLAHQRAVP